MESLTGLNSLGNLVAYLRAVSFLQSTKLVQILLRAFNKILVPISQILVFSHYAWGLLRKQDSDSRIISRKVYEDYGNSWKSFRHIRSRSFMNDPHVDDCCPYWENCPEPA
eukprot:GHVP01069947.1.p2 GENE.GHVP01069947.1~~GHVP01069947.1.p2  ORF type:complete len:111 (+),score=8.90 GHVP01069947.1:1213-1545(+)